MTSLSIATGAKSLVTIGLSLGDIVLLIKHGRNYGNWFRATKNESELLESIMEDHEALLKRKGLIDTNRMNSLWPEYEMMVEGDNIQVDAKDINIEDLSGLSWLMAALIAALDSCLSPSAITGLLIEVFVEALQGDQDTEDSLRVQSPTNIRSWRSISVVRKMSQSMTMTMSRTRAEHTTNQDNNTGTDIDNAGNRLAIPQLDNAERREAKEFLVVVNGRQDA